MATPAPAALKIGDNPVVAQGKSFPKSPRRVPLMGADEGHAWALRPPLLHRTAAVACAFLDCVADAHAHTRDPHYLGPSGAAAGHWKGRVDKCTESRHAIPPEAVNVSVAVRSLCIAMSFNKYVTGISCVSNFSSTSSKTFACGHGQYTYPRYIPL